MDLLLLDLKVANPSADPVPLSFIQYVLTELSSVLGTGDTAVSKTDNTSGPSGAQVQVDN